MTHLGLRALLRWLRVPLAYLLGSVVVSWPLALHLHEVVVGDLEGDVWKHLWGFWWVKRTLLSDYRLPLYSYELNYPYGGSLYFIDTLGALLSVPLQALTSPVVAYNLCVLLNMTLAGTGAWLLARYVTRSPQAAWLAGSIYAWSPYLLSNVASGISESFNVGEIALFLYFLMRTLREPAAWTAVCAGAWLGLATVGCWYYGVFCLVFGSLLTLLHMDGLLLRCHRRELGTGGDKQQLLSAMRRTRLLAGFWLVVVLASGDVLGNLPRSHPGFWGASTLALWGALAFARQAAAWWEGPTMSAGHGGRTPLAFLVVVTAFSLILAVGQLPQHWPPRAWETEPQGLFVVLCSLGVCAVSYTLLMRHLHGAVRDLVATLMWGAGCLLLLAGACWVYLTLPPSPGPLDPWFEVFCRQAWQALAGLGWLGLLALLQRAAPLRIAEVTRLLQVLPRRVRLQAVGSRMRSSSLWTLAACYLLVPRLSPWRTLLVWLLVWVGLALLTEVLAVLRHSTGTLLEQRLAGGWGPAARTGATPRAQALLPLVRRLVLVGGVALMVTVPFAVAFKRTLNSEVSLVYRTRNRGNVDFHLSEHFHNISHLQDLIRPGQGAAVRTYTVDKLTRSSYVGVVTLSLAAYALVARRRRGVGTWVTVAVLATLLSLGPFLYLTPQIYLHGRFPLYMWLYAYFPFFSQISIPFRFQAVTTLALGVACAYAASSLMRLVPRRFRGWMVLWLMLAVWTETLGLSSAPLPVPLASVVPPPHVGALAREIEPRGLIDLPFQRFQGELLPGEYFYYQSLHGKPIPNRVEGNIPIFLAHNRFLGYLFDLEHDYPYYANPHESLLLEGLREMRGYRFGYLVVHDNLFRPGAAPRVHTVLRHFLGAPRLFEQGISVYSLEPIPSGRPSATSAQVSSVTPTTQRVMREDR